MPKWTPNQWDEGDGLYPYLPSWAATWQMIIEVFDFDPETVALTLDGEGEIRGRDRATTVVTIAYGCLRGLTVRETWSYFGAQGVILCDDGSAHPVRALEEICARGDGDKPMSEYVTFPDGRNPLVEIARA